MKTLKMALVGLSCLFIAWSICLFYFNMVADAVYLGVGAVWILTINDMIKPKKET